MTKREAAERNVKAEGNPSNGGIACYPKCPFRKECPHPKIDKNKCSGCTNFCKQWLKDNPVDDWQELKIDDLPRDFLTDTYEVEKMLDGQWCKTLNEGNPIEILVVKNNYPEIKYRYRPRQPEKKEVSHEEMLRKLKMGDIGVFDAVLFLLESATIPPEAE